MDSRYRFLTFGTPWTQSMLSSDINAVTQLAEASWRRDKMKKIYMFFEYLCIKLHIYMSLIVYMHFCYILDC